MKIDYSVKMKYEIKATIPTIQYGNIRPTLTQGEDDSGEDFEKEALERIESLWSTYGEKPLVSKTENGEAVGEKITSFTGEELFYDDDTHIYTDLDGNKLLSGSAYAASVTPKFNKEVMIPKTAKAWDVPEEALDAIWGTSGDIATSYGTSIHNALETYHRYKELGAKIEKKKELDYNYVLPKNEHIRDIVLDFDKQFGTDATVEVLVSDLKNKRAGQIDRLTILDEKKKVCRVGDYKFVTEMDKKKLLKYQHQLSFYAHILMSDGWSIEGIDIYHHNGEWEKIELDVLDLVT